MWLGSFLLLAAGALNAGAIYSVVDLGSLGGSSAEAFGLNASGQAVGAVTTPFGDVRAFSSSGSGMSNLFEGQAAGVNTSGQIAGTQYIGGDPYATLGSNGTAQSIAGGYAMAVDDAGDVAGMLANGHAFRTSNGSIDDLGTLPGGAWTAAYAMNSAGEIAGYGDIGGGTFRGFIWSPGGGYQVLGTLGGMNSYAMAISATGEIAGSAQLANGTIHAFVFNGGTLTDLGTLGGSSYAYGVNDAGEVVGYSMVGGVDHAFVFVDGTMIDLNSLIPAGWILTEAYAINYSGQIVGSGILNGVEHAFRLDPIGGAAVTAPEPAAWQLAGIGAAILIFRSAVRLRLRQRDPRLKLPQSAA